MGLYRSRCIAIFSKNKIKRDETEIGAFSRFIFFRLMTASCGSGCFPLFHPLCLCRLTVLLINIFLLLTYWTRSSAIGGGVGCRMHPTPASWYGFSTIAKQPSLRDRYIGTGLICEGQNTDLPIDWPSQVII